VELRGGAGSRSVAVVGKDWFCCSFFAAGVVEGAPPNKKSSKRAALEIFCCFPSFLLFSEASLKAKASKEKGSELGGSGKDDDCGGVATAEDWELRVEDEGGARIPRSKGSTECADSLLVPLA